MGKDGMRNEGCGYEFVRDTKLDSVGPENFNGSCLGRLRQGMRILAHEQRPRDSGLQAIFHERLADRQDMRFVETALSGAAAVT
jgi:hypothetical protein